MKKIIIILFPICIIAVGGYFLYDAVFKPNDYNVNRIIIIPPRSSAAVITDSLYSAGIIRNKYEFWIALKVLGNENELYPGIYEFNPHESNKDIISDLNHVHNSRHYFVTFPEGKTSFEIAHIAHEQLGIDSGRFIAFVRDTLFIHSLGVRVNSLEGYLFPETYEFDLPVAEKEIIARMVFALQHFFSDSLRQRCRVLGVHQEQILTLASIVEGEAARDSERARIAGVYWNRLRIGMKLEADPTIQYVIGEPRHLYYKDLAIESPYNTYLHPGLPPTPINNPGRASILAALYPESNSYLYFVARGDSSRLHRFSQTFEQHAKAVKTYHHKFKKSKILSNNN